MPATPTSALQELIDQVSPIVTMEREGLVIVALGVGASQTGQAYLTLDEAVSAKAVAVHELGGGSVPTVAVETKGSPVVIFGGDTIVGGKQNRIVNVTIWLTPNKATPIPVTCLERGRWDPGQEARFDSGPKADLRLRSMLNAQVHTHARASAGMGAPGQVSARYMADQGSVWTEVAAKHQRASSTSQTGALHDLYAREAGDVLALGRAFPYPDDAIGAAIGIGGRLIALELFDRPGVARKLWHRVVEGAVRAYLDHRRLVAAGHASAPTHRYPDREALGRMLGRIKRASSDALDSPAVGEGTDVRFATDRITGAALVRDGQVVHAEVHQLNA
jgi:hypothetical protein